MDTEIDDFYKVEHGENFVLNEEQLRKLIWDKFERNKTVQQRLEERERRVKLAE